MPEPAVQESAEQEPQFGKWGEFDWKLYRPPGCVCEFPWNVCDGCKDFRRENPTSVAKIQEALSSSAMDLLNGVGKTFRTRDIVAMGQKIWELIKARESTMWDTKVISNDVAALLHSLGGSTIPEAIWKVVKPKAHK